MTCSVWAFQRSIICCGFSACLVKHSTWVMLMQAVHGLSRVHTHVVLGEDDLPVLHGPWPCRARIEGQEVRGFGWSTPQEPTEWHLQCLASAPILWNIEVERSCTRFLDNLDKSLSTNCFRSCRKWNLMISETLSWPGFYYPVMSESMTENSN